MNQEISFTPHYAISYNATLPFPEGLRICPKELSDAERIIHKNSQMNNVHLLVGKTGAGKTNVLQLLGLEEEERREISGASSAYFLIYKTASGFLLEPFNMFISDAARQNRVNKRMENELSDELKLYMSLWDSMQIYYFDVNAEGMPVNVIPRRIGDLKRSEDYTYIFNGFDRNSFAEWSYEDLRLERFEDNSEWLPRIMAEYHKTALWCSCHFLKEYIESFGENNIKRKAAFVIKSSNWANTVKQHLGENLLKTDYWTFEERRREAIIETRGKVVKQIKRPTIKQQFVHDLWTDYARYLREWIAYIDKFSEDDKGGEISPFGVDIEYWDYYFQKEQENEERGRRKKKNRKKHMQIDPTILPDWEDVSILKRIEWLSMYIDRKDGYTKGLLWQIYSDIKDIGEILLKFDDAYFTLTTFTLPIEEMYTEKNKRLVGDLFERMEQYRPDQVGIFARELLPYRFSCISSGEYQLAKVLGGIEEYCVKLSIGNRSIQPHLIYLLDEPDTYMHPELCRIFLSKLNDILKERDSQKDIQVIISTHSPLLLSDVLPWQVTRLDVDDKGYCIIKNGMGQECFGANIHSILADGFFLQYTIGEYARNYLQNEINWLVSLESVVERTEADNKRMKELKSVVSHIGDMIIRRCVENMLRNLGEDI